MPTLAQPEQTALPASRLSHLQLLEAESIQIFREVASEFQKPVMLYSIGKDSSVMLRLAQKAFYPGPIPFPLLHVDTGDPELDSELAGYRRVHVAPDRTVVSKVAA